MVLVSFYLRLFFVLVELVSFLFLFLFLFLMMARRALASVVQLSERPRHHKKQKQKRHQFHQNKKQSEQKGTQNHHFHHLFYKILISIDSNFAFDFTGSKASTVSTVCMSWFLCITTWTSGAGARNPASTKGLMKIINILYFANDTTVIIRSADAFVPSSLTGAQAKEVMVAILILMPLH